MTQPGNALSNSIGFEKPRREEKNKSKGSEMVKNEYWYCPMSKSVWFGEKDRVCGDFIGNVRVRVIR